jgi:uncharacterized protein YfbU (UPF0304 family)
MTPKSERFELRIDEDQLARIRAWAEEQESLPTAAEAVRRLIDLGLAAGSPRSVHFSDGEKMLILMMADLYKHLRIKDPNCAPEFLAEVIYGGHYWAPLWKLTGVFHGHVDNPEDLDHVVDVLDMWDWLELSHERLSAAERKRVAIEAAPFGEHVRFSGFDGNEEASQLGIARFLIEQLDRFSRFKKRDLNSHHETHATYRRMLKTFLPMRATLTGGWLDAQQIITVLNAKKARS